jgi:DNA-binding NarL/FixJ family response regulator
VTPRKNQPPTRLLIADANAMVCELLTGVFKRRRAFQAVGCAINMQELLTIAEAATIDVALVSAHLQDGKGSGLRAVQELRAVRPDTRCVVLLERSEQNLIAESFRAGAKGVFFRSQHHLDVLCKCISRVHAGQIWASSAELERVMDALRRSSPLLLTSAQGTKLLSKQESKIARLISEGMSNREIAAHLRLSGHTVKNYLFNIFDKLGISNRVELALYVASREDRIDLDVEETVRPYS